MEIELDDTISSLEKIPKKTIAKKGINELSVNLYGAESKYVLYNLQVMPFMLSWTT